MRKTIRGGLLIRKHGGQKEGGGEKNLRVVRRNVSQVVHSEGKAPPSPAP